MAAPSEKQKVIALFIIVGSALAAFYFNLFLRPQFSRFIVNNREFHVIKRRVASSEALIAGGERIRLQYENFKKQSDLLERKFPVQDEISSLLEDFSNTAESSGVNILKIKPLEMAGVASAAGAQGAFYSIFPILIEARAGYHQLGSFINKLENMDRFIKVEKIDIKHSAADPRRHDIILQVVTYVME